MTATDYCWTESEYLQLVSDGRLVNTQLIDGKIYQNSTPSRAHSLTVEKLRRAMEERFGWEYVQSEQPIQANGFPEPDIAILKVSKLGLTDHPTPDEIACVIEVAVSSWQFDTEVKIPVYEEVGIEAAFVVSPNGRMHLAGEDEALRQFLVSWLAENKPTE